MLLTIEKSWEQDYECPEEWLVNTDPGFQNNGCMFYKSVLVWTDSINPLPHDKFQTLPNCKSLQPTIANWTKMAESYPNR